MTHKDKYRILCQSDDAPSLFLQDWWLDVTCGEDKWDVAVIEQNNEIIAALPYYFHTRYKMTHLSQPSLTRNLGPWLKQDNAKYTNQLGNQKKHFTTLINQLPSFAHFTQKFDPNITNWLPFYWHGFSQTTRYTYLLDDLSSLENIWDGFRENIRREIRKAEKKNIIIEDNPNIDEFITLIEKTYTRQNRKLPFSKDFIKTLYNETQNRQCGKIFIGKDEAGHAHAGAFIVWDHNTAYYLIGGGDPDLRNSGATSLVLWNAIQFSAAVVDKFDFEGSMIDPIEKFFRSFGAKQVPYFQISKTNSRLLKIKDFIKDIRK